MIKNYWITALRSATRNKLFTFINIIGLAIGIASSYLIILDIEDDLSYDRFFQDKEQIYRVVLDRKYPDNVISYAIIPFSVGEAMKSDIPEIEDFTRFMSMNNEFIIQYKDKKFKENYACMADSNFFNIFSIPILKGDPDKVLSTPNGVMLSEKTAGKYFGNEDPVGKTLSQQNNELVVTGVFKDIPENSHMKFDLIGSIKATGLDREPNFISFSVFTYIKLKKGTRPADVEKKLPDLVKKYASGQIQRRLGISFEDYTAAGNGYHYYLQPLTSIHLNSRLENEIRPNGNKTYVIILAAIALFLLVIASINFMNLATARSADRAREVGLRKVIGSSRTQLVIQFMTEAFFISFISIILSIVLAELLIPGFNQLAGKNLEIHLFGNLKAIGQFILLGIIIGIVSGIYPAFILSSFQPVKTLKGKITGTKKGILSRNILVVFQFWISIVLISMTFLIIKQMNFLRYSDMGFERNNILLIERAGALGTRMEAFKQELLKNPDIISAGISSSKISGGYYPGIFFQASTGNSEALTTRGMSIDNDFFSTLGLHLTEGRSFSDAFNDSLSLIINESAVREFNLKNPVGTRLYNPQDNGGDPLIFTVIGVVRDFHYNSLHTDIKSFAFMSNGSPLSFAGLLNIKINPDRKNETIGFIRNKWEEFVPEAPFTYNFLSDDLFNMYKSEEVTSDIFGIFSILAILIACIGLFGLAAYIATTRTKEIGIRKVMGSSVGNIIFLLSENFARLVLIAWVLAIPVSWFLMKRWLMNFAYKTEISGWIFILSGLIAFFIAVFTISLHAYRTAHLDPAESLRYE